MSWILKIIQSVSLIASLPQTTTNGGGTLGTLNSPTYPKFLTNNPLPQGYPWGSRTAEGTNSYLDVPNTGVTRKYDFTIKRGTIAPDGVEKSVILVNGQFPGPLIQANWGDMIQVVVHNRIDGPEEGTAVHWHGFSQKKTPWFDGVPSVQQCPIAPNKSFEYLFQASNYGSSWYHSHYSAQYAAGIQGPFVVYGPVQKNVHYDFDLGPVVLSDWYHQEYFDIVEGLMDVPSVNPRSDNNLIQGKGVYDCSLPIPAGSKCTPNAGIAKFKVKKGKSYRLRLINTSAEGAQKFTIDGHNMTIFANDFVPIQPYSTNVVTLGVGQRSDVVVTMDGSLDSYWIRSNISSTLSLGNADPKQRLGLAALYYDKVDTSKTPKSTATPWVESSGNDNLALTQPAYALTPTQHPDLTLNLLIDNHNNASGNALFYINNSSFRANYDHPLLLLANQGNTSYPDSPQWNVENTGPAKSVRLIIRATQPISHPLHLHGHDFYVLAEGLGEWDGVVTNAINPQRRDVHMFPALGNFAGSPGNVDPKNQPYLVLQFDADNPGVWPFHCHIAWHVSAGLYVNIMERPADITEHQIPSIMAQTCRDWAVYSGHNVVDQIDSGL